MGIPSANGVKLGAAHMIARSAERKRQAKTGQKRHPDMKQGGIFQGKLPCQPIIIMIEIIERGLNGGPIWTRFKGGKRGEELVGMRPVFGVIDCDEGALGGFQGIV